MKTHWSNSREFYVAATCANLLAFAVATALGLWFWAAWNAVCAWLSANLAASTPDA